MHHARCCLERKKEELDNRKCEICFEFAAVPYDGCLHCDASPSYHHNRCCPENPRRESSGRKGNNERRDDSNSKWQDKDGGGKGKRGKGDRQTRGSGTQNKSNQDKEGSHGSSHGFWRSAVDAYKALAPASPSVGKVISSPWDKEWGTEAESTGTYLFFVTNRRIRIARFANFRDEPSRFVQWPATFVTR